METELEREAFKSGVTYALEYLSDLYEGVEDTDIAKEYGFTND